MHVRQKALSVGLAGLAGLTLVLLVTQGQRPRPQAATTAAVQAAQFSLDPDTLVGWGRGPVQPVFFSHRRHAGVYEIECLYCHANTDVSPVAYMPTLALCLGCHRVVKPTSTEVQKLRGYEERGQPIPWERIYKVADFVQFNHGRHVRAEVDCEECHGKVDEHDVIYQWAPLTMGWCLECHWEPQEDEEKLAQAARNAAQFGEEGREAHGIYPKSIDSDYGVLNGPIDCAACHY